MRHVTATLLASSLAGSAFLLLTPAAQAQGRGMPRGFGQRGEDIQNLGSIGAGGDVTGGSILVKKVYEGGPAQKGGLQVGDQIVKAGKQSLQPESGANPLGPVGQLVREIERGEASRKKRILVLTVQRAGSEKLLKLPLSKLGKHSRSCPKKCKKCTKIVKAGLAFMARTQSGDGSFPTSLGGKTGMVVVTSLGGLAFLSAGASPKPGSPLAKATTYVLSHANVKGKSPFGGGGFGGGRGGNWNQTNWELSYALMFLSEMARKTRRPDLKAKCKELVAKLNQNMEPSGGWAHGPGGPNALGYLELEIMSNYALLGMGAAKRLGIDLDEGKVGKALAWIVGTSNGDGGVGYSQRQGQKGHGDAGRTAGALVAFAALGQRRHPFFPKMASFYARNVKKLAAGHVSPAMHLLAGAMGSKVLGGKAWKQFIAHYRLHIMGARKPDGSFASTPTRESKSMRNNTDMTVGPRWTTATYVIILSLANGKLPYLLGGKDQGKQKRKKKYKRVRTGRG